ncbi:hypothetical protein CHL67_03495 [Prosthecochloris sp. GSB1]|uniref:hypothetical protein n=1 Tax=Prosthecochloris sp. GSB1 TaxID=281093 RepID=UPI000B8CABD5|nr:hypothetical protein [Prosthecochloris sp. GSB1]ASQ90114.1 hypothetical protein CHL67_03495 [Prosthecochloris sp. GSB1]
MNIEFLLNLIILVMIFYGISVLIGRCNEVMFDEYRFKYFALRDKLALMVVDGKISEGSVEYKFLINAINYHIKTVETVSMIRVIELLVRYHNSPEESREVSMITRKVENVDSLAIVLEFMRLSNSLLYRNSRVQMKALDLLVQVVPLNKILVKKSGMREIKTTSEKINSNIDRLTTALSNKHAMAV